MPIDEDADNDFVRVTNNEWRTSRTGMPINETEETKMASKAAIKVAFF